MPSGGRRSARGDRRSSQRTRHASDCERNVLSSVLQAQVGRDPPARGRRRHVKIVRARPPTTVPPPRAYPRLARPPHTSPPRAYPRLDRRRQRHPSLNQAQQPDSPPSHPRSSSTLPAKQIHSGSIEHAGASLSLRACDWEIIVLVSEPLSFALIVVIPPLHPHLLVAQKIQQSTVERVGNEIMFVEQLRPFTCSSWAAEDKAPPAQRPPYLDVRAHLLLSNFTVVHDDETELWKGLMGCDLRFRRDPRLHLVRVPQEAQDA